MKSVHMSVVQGCCMNYTPKVQSMLRHQINPQARGDIICVKTAKTKWAEASERDVSVVVVIGVRRVFSGDKLD
jgi:hypothetical protein